MRMDIGRKWLATAGLLLALTLAVGACGTSLTDTNQNPNEPTDVPAANILSGATVELGNTEWASFWHMSLWSTWSQLLSEIQYPDEDRYRVRLSTLDGYWNDLYDRAKDFSIIEQKGANGEGPNVEAVGKIMKSYTFHILTDAWGPVPYSEALQLDQGGSSTPAYDGGATIYAGMLQDLTTAANEIDAGSDPFGSNDVIYGGDMQKWQRFANSLRLRFAMRLSSTDNGTAQSEAEAAIAAGTFESNADNAVLSYQAQAPNRNPVYVNGLTRDDHAPSETMLAMMRNWQDPRMKIYAQPAPNSSASDPVSVRYLGASPGQSTQPVVSAGGSLNDIARIGTFWRSDPGAPMYFMTYAEVEFLKAEAALRGYNVGSGDAQSHYEAGIQASMDQYGISQDSIDNYMSQSGVAWDPLASTGVHMQQIATQKWMSLYMGDAVEAYAEIRRLGLPDIAPGPDASNVNSGAIPERIVYPPLEPSLNGSSWQAAVSQYFGGSDDMSGQLFWDPNPTDPPSP